MTAAAQEKLVERLIAKIKRFEHEILDWEERDVEGAEVVVLSYGISARIATRAIAQAREKGIKVGFFRLITAWPFPEQRVREISRHIKGFVVPEINYGQIAREVARCARDNCQVVLVPNAGGAMHDPKDILDAILMVAKGAAPKGD